MAVRSDLILIDDDQTVDLSQAPMISHVINLGVDWENRIYHMSGEITDETGEHFWTVLRHLGKDPIELHLNTPGGSVDAMFAIVDAMRLHGAIHVTGYGQICSAGVLILAAGHKRTVTESCVAMSHEPTLGTGELGLRASKDRRQFDDWSQDHWCKLMSRYTGHDAIWWARKTQRQAEFWMLGGAAIVEAGLADRVA